MNAPAQLPPLLVLYDGVCGLCDRSVQFLLRHDRRARLSFAALQGETARPILERHGLAGELGSFVLVRDAGTSRERLHLRSSGALEVTRELGGAWRLARALRVVPRRLRDAVYDWVARRRYGWFGTLDACRVPGPEVRSRFLP
jgi:predicted DCC family thiol-disulfide oxidoreductase YuxK